MTGIRRILVPLLATAAAAALAAPASAAAPPRMPNCDGNNPVCTEPFYGESPSGAYIGHDEPMIQFRDPHNGAGYDVTYRIQLPSEPGTFPTQDATNGVNWDFELRAAYWFGMMMCDTQSAPEYQHDHCAPDSDRNIFASGDPSSDRYIGKAPGNAFMEVQFYPPGWVPQFTGFDCPGLKWCISLTIDSLSLDQNTGLDNNASCLGLVGREPVNWAYLTHSGVPHAPPDPISLITNPATGNPNPATDLQMNPGDLVTLHVHDTPSGVQVDAVDRTTGETGSMTASAANGFEQVVYDPTASTCTEQPYDFHPEFASSTTDTRSTWAAHGGNVSASDEIGHFEWCDTVTPDFTCSASPTPGDPDDDDFPCYPSSFSSLVPVSGCIALAGDTPDFDSPSYQHGTWPGDVPPAAERRMVSTPMSFTSPTFRKGRNYQSVAFEVNTPRIEAPDSGGICDRTTGTPCPVVPPGASFYPIYTTRDFRTHCFWQIGGAHYPGTTNDFGGTPESEYGTILPQLYPFPTGPGIRFNDYRNDLGTNPCRY